MPIDLDLWKTAERSVSAGVIGDLSAERRSAKSGKYCLFSDLFIVTIQGPHKCLMGHPSRRTQPACLHENSATVPRQHTLNLPIPPFGGNDFLKPAPAVVLTRYSGEIPEESRVIHRPPYWS